MRKKDFWTAALHLNAPSSTPNAAVGPLRLLCTLRDFRSTPSTVCSAWRMLVSCSQTRGPGL